MVVDDIACHGFVNIMSTCAPFGDCLVKRVVGSVTSKYFTHCSFVRAIISHEITPHANHSETDLVIKLSFAYLNSDMS